jgi:hypothetical protein
MSGWWKFYFVVISLQVVGAPVGAYFTGTLGPSDVVDWVFICIGAIGLYGYVYKKDLAQPNFWLVFLPLFVLWDIWMRLVQPSITDPRPETTYYIVSLALFAFLTPQYIALYRYGRRSALDDVP